MSIFSIPRCFVFSLLILANPLHAEWRMEVLPDEWHLAGFENSLDLSGIAAANDTQCLIGSDESFYIQPGVIEVEKRRIESRRPIPLEVDAEPTKAEVDIEGVAFCPLQGSYYVIGSHGVSKKKGTFEPDRHSLYQVPVDPETGVVLKEEIRKTSLLPWLKATPLIAEYVGQPLQLNGLNIEGLTVRGNQLYFGLRAPNIDGRGLVIELDSAKLFQEEVQALKVHQIVMEEGRGIRDIVAVRDGFILVTGNASSQPSKKIPHSEADSPDNRFEILFWDGEGEATVKVGKLPENGGKGEGLLVLEDEEDHVDLLVVFDGLIGGEPMTIRIHR